MSNIGQYFRNHISHKIKNKHSFLGKYCVIFNQRREILKFSLANMGEDSNMGEYLKLDDVIPMKGSSYSIKNWGKEKDVEE
jgi:hypothetical protein